MSKAYTQIAITDITDRGIDSITELYYCSSSKSLPGKPTSRITTSSDTIYNAWNLTCPVPTDVYKYYYTCSEVLYTDGTRNWSNVVNNNGYASANNVKIGGMNLMLDTANKMLDSSGAAGSSVSVNMSVTKDDIILGEDYTLSLDFDYSNMIWNDSANYHRVGAEGYVKYADGTYTYFSNWRSFTQGAAAQTYKGRVSKTFTVSTGHGAITNLGTIGLYKQGCTGNVKLSKLKFEKSNKASDWSPAPEDIDDTLADYTKTQDLSMFDMIDGKETIFYQPYQPTEQNERDMWCDTNTHKVYQYILNSDTGYIEWQEIDNNAIAIILRNLSQVANVADGKVRTFYQSEPPTEDLDDGDLWFDDNNVVHRYNGTAWVNTQDKSLIDIAKWQTELIQYMHFDPTSGLILGDSDSKFQTIIDSTAMTFKDGTTTVAFISNNELNINKAILKDSTVSNVLRIGNFVFRPRGDNGMSLAWEE